MMSKKVERQKHQSLFRTCGVRDNAKWSTLWRVEGTFLCGNFNTQSGISPANMNIKIKKCNNVSMFHDFPMDFPMILHDFPLINSPHDFRAVHW